MIDTFIVKKAENGYVIETDDRLIIAHDIRTLISQIYILQGRERQK